MARIHLITQAEHTDATFTVLDFEPEAWRDEVQAEKRLEQLQLEYGPHSGVYFKLEEIELN